MGKLFDIYGAFIAIGLLIVTASNSNFAWTNALKDS
jgi:hypothetical protein